MGDCWNSNVLLRMLKSLKLGYLKKKEKVIMYINKDKYIYLSLLSIFTNNCITLHMLSNAFRL